LPTCSSEAQNKLTDYPLKLWSLVAPASLRTGPSYNHFNINRRHQLASKDFALRAACAAKPKIPAIAN
jgi:hypothetical protein